MEMNNKVNKIQGIYKSNINPMIIRAIVHPTWGPNKTPDNRQNPTKVKILPNIVFIYLTPHRVSAVTHPQ